MQAKRIQVAEGNLGAGGAINVALQPVGTAAREAVNYHNIWVGASAEPQDAAANMQGTWVLFALEDPASSITTFTDAFLNLETRNVFIIACGVYSASNESPWTLPPTQIKTSRTLNQDGRLILQLVNTGITAGLASLRVMLSAHTTRK